MAGRGELPGWINLGLLPLLNLTAAFVVSGLIVLLLGENPLEAVRLLLFGAFGYEEAIGYTLFYATSFIFTGLAVAVAFHCGLFNIGGEGQAYLGGLGVTLVGLHLGWLPWGLAVPAAILGAATLDFLDLGDGALRTGQQEEDAIIEVLRRRRPELVLGPTPADRHPDHGRAHRLVADACFYAGLRMRGAGEAHRPAAVFSYMQHDGFEPSFVVDVTSVWAVKMRALDAYESQIHPGSTATATGADPAAPPTKIEAVKMLDDPIPFIKLVAPPASVTLQVGPAD